MNLARNITFTIDETYLPMIIDIDEIAIQCESSRSGVIRSLLCEALEFTPTQPVREYDAKKLMEKKN